MVSSYSWIKATLDGHFNQVDWREGLDLDEDGVITPSEKIQDYNNDGQIGDSRDWEHFLVSNTTALQRQVDFFRWAAPLKTDNPIHECLSIESELVTYVTPKEVEGAYAFVVEVLKRVRVRLADGTQRSNQEKLRLVYDVMAELVYFSEGITALGDLLTDNIMAKTLDCDTSSFVVCAIAHEMGWPVYPVYADRHLFVRWDETSGERFNMDLGKVHEDQYYVEKNRLPQASIDAGVYLSSRSSREEWLALFLTNRGLAKSNLRRDKEAIRDFTEDIRLDPKYVLPYFGRFLSRGALGHDIIRWKDLKIAYCLEGRSDRHKQPCSITPKYRTRLSK